MSHPDTRPLDPSQLDDWLAFFDRDAFADNPEWGACYCRCYVFGGGGMEAWDRACETRANRGAMADAIRAGRIDGLLARRDGRVVGWVQFGPTSRFHSPVGRLGPVEEGVASIVCFVVAAPHRRTGVSRALLRAAVDDLGRRGFRAVDARPQTHAAARAAEQFTGPLALYLSEGFSVVESGERTTRVRRVLALEKVATRIRDIPPHMRTGSEYWLVRSPSEPFALLEMLVESFAADGWSLEYAERNDRHLRRGGASMSLCLDTTPTAWCRVSDAGGGVTYEGPRWPSTYADRLIVEFVRAL